MYYFVVYGSGSNERWTMVESSAKLSREPSFKSIMQISHDPDDFINQGMDPNEKVRYLGPMYFDLDGDNINEVIVSAQKLYKELTEDRGVPEAAIRIYLSGKKGFHFTIDEKVFGITKPRLTLPYIWGEFAKSFVNEHIDRSVYTGLKGRMWRTCNVRRPDNQRYKVQIDSRELESLRTEEQYVELTSEPRTEFDVAGEVHTVPKLVSQIDACAESVKEILKAQKKAAESISVEDLRESEGVPGCITKLITEGDCAESNWNQAAMQLAGYIAARYEADEEDEYQPLIEQFLENVTSGTRPSVAERRKSFNYLYRKAFQGGIKFSAGGIIATLGGSCGSCVICTRKEMTAGDDGDGNYYCPKYKIQLSTSSISKVSENSSKELANFGMEILRYELVRDDNRELVIYSRRVKTIKSCGSVGTSDVEDASFYDHRKLQQDLSGRGLIWMGTDNELKTVMVVLDEKFKDADTVIRTRLAGITIEEKKDKDTGEVKHYPHLVCRESSHAKGGTYSNYAYTGPFNSAPNFHDVEDFSSEDEVKDSIETIKKMFGMNELETMTAAIGWVAAAHLKAHLTYNDKSFPMLNISGSSGTGKTSTAAILLTLNAFPHRKAPFWNAEVDTMFPLEDLVTSSTTVIRMLEEVNQHNVQKRNWDKLTGILKSSWDEGGIMKGSIKGRTVVTTTMPNPAPIMYLSEQAFPVQSIRTRSIECHFSNIAIEDKECISNHQDVLKNVKHLEKWAKVLANIALNTSFRRIDTLRSAAEELVPEVYTGRMRTAYGVVIVGLQFLRDSVGEFSEEFYEWMDERIKGYVTHLASDASRNLDDKRTSALDEVISALDTMASESDNPNHGLLPDTHYWVSGTTLYLDIWAAFPRFRRYARGIGYETSITSHGQLLKLLKGETYYQGITASRNNPLADVVVLDMQKMREKGIRLSNFEE